MPSRKPERALQELDHITEEYVLQTGCVAVDPGSDFCANAALRCAVFVEIGKDLNKDRDDIAFGTRVRLKIEELPDVAFAGDVAELSHRHFEFVPPVPPAFWVSYGGFADSADSAEPILIRAVSSGGSLTVRPQRA